MFGCKKEGLEYVHCVRCWNTNVFLSTCYLIPRRQVNLVGGTCSFRNMLLKRTNSFLKYVNEPVTRAHICEWSCSIFPQADCKMDLSAIFWLHICFFPLYYFCFTYLFLYEKGCWHMVFACVCFDLIWLVVSYFEQLCKIMKQYNTDLR